MPRGTRGFTPRGSGSFRGSRGSTWSPNYRGGGRGFHGSSSSVHSAPDRRYYGNSNKYEAPRRSHDDYRKPYKSDSMSYSSRDRSPERKRMRTESSHDRSFGGGSGGGEYKNRYENERRSYSNDQRVSSYVRKEDFRKPLPPTSSPRGGGGGGYRGRSITSRGGGGGSLRGGRMRDTHRPLRKRLIESSYAVKRRILTSRTTDYARRIKVNKMRSAIVHRPRQDDSDNDDDDDDEDHDDDDDESDDDHVKDESDIEENDDDDHKMMEKSPPAQKSSKGEHNDDFSAPEGGHHDDEIEEQKTYFKLTCPHCHITFGRFGHYNLHLQSGRHAATMRRIASKQKTILSKMRTVQRKVQLELERYADDLEPRTSWCPLCKLNYKQSKITHQTSAAHLDMKRFLMPTCRVCKITFKSPMLYQSHCCSPVHLKRKAAAAAARESKEALISTEEDLENFMTIDSVGDVDEEMDNTAKPENDEALPGMDEIEKVEVYYCNICRVYLGRQSDEEEVKKELAKHCKLRTHIQKCARPNEEKVAVKKEDAAVKGGEKSKDESPKKKTDEAAPAKGEKNSKDANEAIAENVLRAIGDVGKFDDDEDEDSVANDERYDRFKSCEQQNADERKACPPSDDSKAKEAAEKDV